LEEKTCQIMKKIKDFFIHITSAKKPLRTQWWIGAVVVLLVASFLRLYNLEGSLQFLGDQGRDALIVSKIFKDGDLVFIGPVTSVGNMYLGPLYYYFMMPFLWMSYPSPMGPAYAVAMVGIVTVILMYVLGKELIGHVGASIGATLFALSSTVIIYTRFSWNPNPAPLVSLVMIWATYKAWKKSSWHWLLVGLCFSILIQLHYLTLLSAAGAGLVWLLKAWELWKQGWKKSQKEWITLGAATGGAIIIFLISLTPLMLFDWKHDWLNVRSFTGLFTKEKSFTVVTELPWWQKASKTVLEMHGRALHIFFEISLGKFRLLNTLLTVGVFASLWIIWKKLGHATKDTVLGPQAGLTVLLCYLLTGIFGTAFYQHTVFDHYIAYLFPVTYLLFGLIMAWLIQNKWGKVVAGAFFIGFVALNIPKYPLMSAGWTAADMRETSKDIAEHITPGEKYALVLLSETKDLYGQNYRYFLHTFEKPPLSPEMINVADTLVVINEEGVKNPINNSIYEIEVFPSHTPSEVYTTKTGLQVLVLRRPAVPTTMESQQ
jgi:hypothetical protein